MKSCGCACCTSSTRSSTGATLSTALSGSPRIWNSTSAACPLFATWSPLAGSSGDCTCCTTSSVESPETTSPIAALKAGSSVRSESALDQDALAGGLLEPGVEDPVHAAGLARRLRCWGRWTSSQRAADAEGDDHEREPSERSGLPVSGTPATHPGRQVPLGLCRVTAFLLRVVGGVANLESVAAPRPRREAGFALVPSDDPRSSSGRRRRARGWVRSHMSKLGPFLAAARSTC